MDDTSLRSRGQLLGFQFSLSMLILFQFLVCCVAVFWWYGFLTLVEALLNLSQFTLVLSLIVACVVWRKWYLIAATVAITWEVYSFGVTRATTRWLAEVVKPEYSEVPATLMLLVHVQFYAIIIARCLLLASTVGFLSDVIRGKVRRNHL